MSLPHENEWPLPPTVPSFSSLDARELPKDAEDIEKDLHRAGRLDLGISDADVQQHYEALRRVLRAWCHIGSYSQAMSRVGATLLANTDHDAEKAFLSFSWIMCALPKGYYDAGYLTDVRALRLLAAWRWPDAIVPSLYEPLELVASTWFLSLWAGILPAACCVAVWAELVLTDADEPSSNGDVQHCADTSLRVALVLLETSLEAIREAVELDAAEADAGAVVTDADGDDAPSFSVASYAALQQAADWDGPRAAALVEKATSLELPKEAVAEARRLAASQLRAEADKRAREKAALRAAEEERREREERLRIREQEGAEGGASTSTRLAEQQLAAYQSEVDDERARKAAARQAREAREGRGKHHAPPDSQETQVGDLQEVRTGARALLSCGSCGCGGVLDTCVTAIATCVFIVPACLVASASALWLVGKRCFGRGAGAVSATKRRTRRRTSLADQDEERASAAERGVELADVTSEGQ